MKSIYLLAISALISVGSLAQANDEAKEKDKKEKSPKASRVENDQVTRHEKIIWAGTDVKLNDKSKDTRNVPDAVLTSFRQFFPDQPIDNVRKYRGLYAITFSNEVYTTTLIYKADGTFVEARTVATDSILPSVVKDKLKERNKEYSPDEVVMIEKPNKEKFYRLHLKENHKERFAVYNEHGDEVNYSY
jgi:hypothetical protein